MFGIGTTELLIIMLVALVVLGPTKLPGIARSLGKALGEFRRVSTDVQRTLNLEAARIEEDEKHKAKQNASPKPETQEAPAGAPSSEAFGPSPYDAHQASEAMTGTSPATPQDIKPKAEEKA